MSTLLTDLFGGHPEVRLLEFLAQNREFDYTIMQLSRGAGVSRPATYKVVRRFLEQGVLTKTRQVGASAFFRLEEEHPLVKPLLDLDLEIRAEPPARRRLPARRRAGR